jgi:spermidine/putrescine transport system substrate-binding protein
LPVRDAVSTFSDHAKEVPAFNLDVKDLENPDGFRLLTSKEVQRRTATWTEVKAS